MTQVGKREFLQHASKYLNKAKDGEEIVITHRNKPELKLVPVRKKSILNLRGKMDIKVLKGDINDPVFPPFDQWCS
ncbi:MAG: type II toxin-antitoxin system prevent-host-death family antitoxin [Deltaproteobacteria bacterium]|nr:type II toxin-antitoxin system prevent-host-death family antitoxin [Deltaproteobacteria bacterium]